MALTLQATYSNKIGILLKHSLVNNAAAKKSLDATLSGSNWVNK